MGSQLWTGDQKVYNQCPEQAVSFLHDMDGEVWSNGTRCSSQNKKKALSLKRQEYFFFPSNHGKHVLS